MFYKTQQMKSQKCLHAPQTQAMGSPTFGSLRKNQSTATLIKSKSFTTTETYYTKDGVKIMKIVNNKRPYLSPCPDLILNPQ